MFFPRRSGSPKLVSAHLRRCCLSITLAEAVDAFARGSPSPRLGVHDLDGQMCSHEINARLRTHPRDKMVEDTGHSPHEESVFSHNLLLRRFFLGIFPSQMIWSDDPLSEYDPSSESSSAFNSQFVSLFFLDVEDGVEVSFRSSFRWRGVFVSVNMR